MIDLLVALLLQDAPASAPTAAAPAAQEEPVSTPRAAPTPSDPARTEENVVVEAPNLDRPRCRRSTADTGSIIARRVCTTLRQDREREQRDQAQLETFQRRQTGVRIPRAGEE